MADGKSIDLTYEEGQAYMYLGIAAANSGMRQILAKTKNRIDSGELDPHSGDLHAWFADNVDETELLELKSFRESVLHSGVLVHADGSIDVYDRRDGQQGYTLEQLKQWALRFLMLRFENRVEMTMQVRWGCPACGSYSRDLSHIERGSEIDFPCGLRMLYQTDGNILTPCGSIESLSE